MITILFRRAMSVEWQNHNPILAKNEIGYDETIQQHKLGDGKTPWNELPFGLDFLREKIVVISPTRTK